MLQYIKIKNLALLSGVTLELDSGFTAVTGETGAGKSVLLGALGLLAGARTDKTMIRQGSDELEVEAALYFEDSAAIDAELEAAGLPLCEEGVFCCSAVFIAKRCRRFALTVVWRRWLNCRDWVRHGLIFTGPVSRKSCFRSVVSWRCWMPMRAIWKR